MATIVATETLDRARVLPLGRMFVNPDCSLAEGDKRLVRLACLAPFSWAVLRPQGGLGVTLKHLGIVAPMPLEHLRAGVSLTLSIVALLAPLVVFVVLQRRGRAVPLISLALIMVNAVWWTAFNYINAFFWAALFHGVVRERTRRPEDRRGWAFHAGVFYGASVALAYLLFVLRPDAYVALGYERLLTAQLVVAVINIHHFVVDAYIWRLRGDPNLRTVVDQPVPAQA